MALHVKNKILLNCTELINLGDEMSSWLLPRKMVWYLVLLLILRKCF